MQNDYFNENSFRISLRDERHFCSLINRFKLLIRIKSDIEKRFSQNTFRPFIPEKIETLLKNHETPSILSVINAEVTDDFMTNIKSSYLVSESDFYSQIASASTISGHDYSENIRRISTVHGRELAYEFFQANRNYLTTRIPTHHFFEIIIDNIFPFLDRNSFTLRRATQNELSYDCLKPPTVRLENKDCSNLCEIMEQRLVEGLAKTLEPSLNIDMHYWEWNEALIRTDTFTLLQ